MSGAQRGRERHAALAADAHGGRIAQPPRPPAPPRLADNMDDTDIPRHRPMAFDKMESLIKEMQDPETGVPVRSQKLFLTYIPSAFMGYDLVEWLMERFNLDESTNVEAINLANQLCQYGYFFPVNDSKNLILKDDSSLYRFQSPYYWPWQAPRVAGGPSAPTLGPDNVEYAIYLVKRTLRNKQRHGLEEYELEALANLKKNLAAKWDFITMQAEEQVRLAKERKKGDKIVSDSQERAYWRVARPPPGMSSALEPCPVPVRARSARPKRNSIHQLVNEIELLKASLDRTRVKSSIALEALMAYSETFAPYDPWLTPPQPTNPWVSDDTIFWQINSPIVEIPSEKRVQRWAISIDELVLDPTGLQEFTSFLRKEYSHENIRFWLAVTDLRRSSSKDVQKKLDDIYEEFLKPGAPCEINIDGATAEKVAEGMRTGSRYALDNAAEHVYNLLLKKDCYPRFIRSDHFQRLLTEGKNVLQKKAKFFNFGAQVKKKVGPATASSSSGGGTLTRRRGSDRSLSGSAHELALSAVQPPRPPEPPPHSHSQTNLADIPFREPADDDDVAPWDSGVYGGGSGACSIRRRQDSAADSGSSSSDVSAVPERSRRLPQQSTLDGGLRGAPPPLRRLSAIEPRHLAPLGSPPRARPAPPLAHVAHPTPTISVSSAPEDDSPTPPRSPRSLPHSDEPSSVFASADATPTDGPRAFLDKTLSSSSSICDNVRTDAVASNVEVKVRSESDASPIDTDVEPRFSDTSVVAEISSPDRTAPSDDNVASTDDDSSREPSTIKETSPASKKETSSKIGDLPERVGSVDKPVPPADPPLTAAVNSGSSAVVSKKIVAVIVEDDSLSGDKQKKAKSSTEAVPVWTTAPEVRVEVCDSHEVEVHDNRQAEVCDNRNVDMYDPPRVKGVCDTRTQEVSKNQPVQVPDTRPKEVSDTHPLQVSESRRPTTAPLAECEDVGVDDDNIDKVPSVPVLRVSEVSKAESGEVATFKIAHKDELSSVSDSNVVNRDIKCDARERKQRNDICPWEDE